jgi:hypothetical protein
MPGNIYHQAIRSISRDVEKHPENTPENNQSISQNKINKLSKPKGLSFNERIAKIETALKNDFNFDIFY